MNKEFLKKIRRLLLRQRENILSWLNDENYNHYLQFGMGPGEKLPEELEVIGEIDSTLQKVENNTFGKCELCSGEVEQDRLILDFTTCVCLDHYSEEQKRELEHDLELAAQVQQHLLPGSLPELDGVKMAVLSRPFGAVGGDYYDFFRYRDHCQGLAIADVMGKGVPAGMLMANLQASLRIMGPDFTELSKLGIRLNELFRFNLKQIRFITLFLAGYNPESRMLHYINAGHHPPLFWNASTKLEKWLKPTGPAIGLMPNATFRSKSLQLNRGDWLILYTDGLVEARNEQKQEFGFERLAKYTSFNTAGTPELFLNGLLNKVKNFGADIRDDLTVMVLKID
ncbi:MAG: SpoIIE family protein phosphatase [Balneolaceae bacterium]|jgi:sigma-B regulation protein RsbU (phosphoserine phosphatase)